MQVENRLRERLETGFSPSFLEISNESHMHNVAPGSESHFKVVLASNHFEGMPRVRRHQAVYALVGDFLDGGVHALALHTYTPAEWQTLNQAPASPRCHGGEKSS